MTVPELLREAASRGVELWVEGERLRFRAEKGALVPQLRDAISVHREAVIATLRAEACERRVEAPASYNQRALWFLAQTAPASSAYHVAFSARVVSLVDLPALRAALQALVDRHEALRTTIPTPQGALMQCIHGFMEPAFRVVDASGWSEESLHAAVRAAYEEPFDLSKGPLVRVNLFSRAPADHVLLLTLHHIAADGWSLWLLLDEWRTLYAAHRAGRGTTLPRPQITYATYTALQAEMLAGPEGERLWSYWQRQLAGELPVLNLPLNRPRPPALSLSGAACALQLGEALSALVKEFARTQGTTPFVVLLAAYYVLLSRYSGQQDIIVGTPTFGRTRPEFERLVGDLISPVPLRLHGDEHASFTALVAHVRDVVLEALDHQDFPFALLVERLGVRRDASRSPVFQAGFNFQKPQRSSDLTQLLMERIDTPVDFGGLALEPYLLTQQEGQLDLTLEVAEVDGSFACALKYSTDLFEEPTARRMLRHFAHLLEGALAAAEEEVRALEILHPDERRQLLVEWNATDTVHPSLGSVADAIEQQAVRTPDAVAVAQDSEFLTYAQLDARANQLAHRLVSLGVGPDVLVGVGMDRTPALLVALLAVWKAQGAYVPLDPAYPHARLADMIRDAGMNVLITNESLRDTWPQIDGTVLCLEAEAQQLSRLPTTRPLGAANSDALAYVIYTSGSTGRPKGVGVPQRALLNFLYSMRERPGMQAGDVVVAVTTLSFDIAALELYLPLICGARVELATREEAMDGHRLTTLLQRAGATILQATPATWRLLLQAGWRGAPRLKMLCGGEALPPDLAGALLEVGGELWNMYGPTETTVWSAIERIGDAGTISIGRPIANTRLYVLDGSLQPVPIGVHGELYIGGVGVARGYHNRPDLTRERFLADPFTREAGGRMYRTGDVARYRPDGRVECLGRVDHQVKVHGFRIELGEIESVLAKHPRVAQAAAALAREASSEARLVAYVVPTSGELDPAELRRFMKQQLPEYMVPALFMALDALPLTANGKVDRARLPEPLRVSPTAWEAPATEAERTLAAIWAEVLRVERVGAHDNFFDLGGHSLLATQVIARVAETFGIQLTVRTLFEASTIRQLGEHVDGTLWALAGAGVGVQSGAEKREEFEL